MKKLALLGFLLLVFATCAVADELTFSFILGAPISLTASAAGLSSGPAMNVVVSDTTTGTHFSLAGTFTASTGPATIFHNFGTFIDATYSAGGVNSVLIVDPSNNPLVKGNMEANGAFNTTIPRGTGAFLGMFDVTFVSPAVLAMFGLGPGFLPVGSVAATFVNDNFDGTTVTGRIGGGTVTIQTPRAVVPESASLGLLGMGLLTTAGVLRRRRL